MPPDSLGGLQGPIHGRGGERKGEQGKGGEMEGKREGKTKGRERGHGWMGERIQLQSFIKQEAQLPQRNSASAAHIEGGG